MFCCHTFNFLFRGEECSTFALWTRRVWCQKNGGIVVTMNRKYVFVLLCSYSYMIDNIILLITGTLHHRPISELIPKCHPLGSFEQMEAIHVAATPAELYNAVLVDTPLGMCSHIVRKTNGLLRSIILIHL